MNDPHHDLNPLREKDAHARREALDPKRSFIIQAPAGSGKTELLICRILTLLSVVEAPEEILAITFTRKAAAEMRRRIVDALLAARDEDEPQAPHKQLTWRLARQALARDAQKGWQLTDNANRLRIMTIDSFCSRLTRQMPWLSRLGAPPAVAERAELLYREAARRTLALLDSDPDHAPHVARVLGHFDNQIDRVLDMLAHMLARRDQWLPLVVRMRNQAAHAGVDLRATLEQAQAGIITETLAKTAALIPPVLVDDLLRCARFAAAILQEGGAPASPLTDLQALPPTHAQSLEAWLAIADLLLTSSGGIRRKVDRRVGFPAESSTKVPESRALYKDMKVRMEALLAALAEMPGVEAGLNTLRGLPPARFEEGQWQVLEALFEVLPRAVAELILVFNQEGQVDFTEIALRALDALGEEEAPTDLALNLDCRLAHVLIDEFQDTSVMQFFLLRKLVAGWQPGDGRTVCLMGDPQQSIYRFRAAEVGLFLRVREEGVGAIRPQPLELCANFRSQAGVVDWVNTVFATVLPPADDSFQGAVRYSPSVAAQAPVPDAPVCVHVPQGETPADEARLVARLVAQELARGSDMRVAILVRSRGHLAAILPQLRAAGLRFQAVEIEHLARRPVIQDLMALTLAMSHAADRVNWLALLRAPWCGLQLADLLVLAGESGGVLIDRLRDPALQAQMSTDGRDRLLRILPVLEAGLATWRQQPLRRWVEGIWLGLGGPACITAADLPDVAEFFDLLQSLDEACQLPDAGLLEEALDQLFAPADTAADGRIQVMTIHKSKGLEFEAVILPGLHRPPPAPSQKLLQWCQLPARDGEAPVILAPARAAADDRDALYSWVSRVETARERFEVGRLLYVAATRAKVALHLVGHVRVDGEAVKAPRSDTLLGVLWPAVKAQFIAAAMATPAAMTEEGEQAPIARPVIHRLNSDWRLPAEIAYAIQVPRPGNSQAPVWQSPVRRHLGTVTHRLLARIASDGLDAWPSARLEAERHWARAALRQIGVPAAEIEAASVQVIRNVLTTVNDPRGRWLLSQHRAAACELPVSGSIGDGFVHLAIDRTFIDDSGVRWVVDWKTAVCEADASLDVFLDAEAERYREQLERYARFMRVLDGNQVPVRVGLYFPAHAAWREWVPGTGA